MTRDETKVIIRAMIESYPNYKPNDITATVDIWSQMLADYDYSVISKALQKYILSNTSGFAPSIGQLVGLIDTPISREPLEAWALVRKAIQNSLYHADEEFAKLPAEIQASVGNAANLKEMAQMDTDTVESVEQSHFIRSYQSVLRRMEDEKRIPENLRTFTAQIIQKMEQPRAIEQKEFTEEPVKYTDRIPLEELMRQKREKRNEMSEVQN